MNYIHVHEKCLKCGECRLECEHRTKWTSASTSTSPNTESDKSIDDDTGVLTELDIKLLQLESLAYIPRKRGEPDTFDLTELRTFIRQLVLDERQTYYSLLMDVIGEDDIQKPNDEDYQEWLVCDTCEVIIDPELKTYECNCKLLNNLRQTQRTKLKELFNVKEK